MNGSVKLIVLSDYRSRDYSFEAGQVIEVSAILAQWLISDAPECFKREEGTAIPLVETSKTIEKPSGDKMIKRAKRTKSPSLSDESFEKSSPY